MTKNFTTDAPNLNWTSINSRWDFVVGLSWEQNNVKMFGVDVLKLGDYSLHFGVLSFTWIGYRYNEEKHLPITE